LHTSPPHHHSLLFSRYRAARDLHSFPTRRSSDLAITADDLDGALERLKVQGIEPEKPPYTVREGGSRLCFVRDPDGYRIELIEKDRKSTRLNSSHVAISYAVFCLKKKKTL